MSNQKEFTLTISERVAAVKLFDEFKGSISSLSQIMEDVKTFVVTKEEWTAAKLTKIPSDEDIAKMGPEDRKSASQTWNWSDEGTEKVVNLGQESLDYLRGKIKTKSDAGELTLGDKALISLSGKLA